MKHFLILFPILFAVFSGCKHYPPDLDNTQSKALRLISGVPIQDNIAPKRGDSVDWRMFVSNKDVRVNVVYTIGEQYKSHNVRGEIIVFDRPGNVIVRKPVVPGKRDYTIMFTAHKQAPYYFEFHANSGAAGYLISCTTDSLDPCAKCGPSTTCCMPTGICCSRNTKCVAGECVSRNVCDPPCSGDRICRDNVCISACGHRCRRGSVCDVRLGRCIRTHKRRHYRHKNRPKCRSGQSFDPGLGHCVSNVVPANIIIANVLSVTHGPSGETLIVVDRGVKHGVKRGYRAKAGGVTLLQYNLTRTRSTWKTKKLRPSDVLSRYKRIRIIGN